MRIIVSGGGTGGHIYPAITIIRAIKEREKNAQFLYVGTKKGLEADIVPKEGLPFESVNIEGFERRLTAKNIKTAAKAMAGVAKALKTVKNFRPDVAVGTGGYVCGPTILAASMLHIPTLIQEQNVVAGITNRILSRMVTKIAIGVEEAKKNFPAEKTIFTGNPIRREVMTATREEGLKFFGFDANKKIVLVSGGSRGARSINIAMTEVLKKAADDPRVQFLHVTGKSEYDEVMTRLRAAGADPANTKHIRVEPYLYNMPQAMAMADLAVFRAGATGIAELTARGVPSILIPYPYAAENHQEFNARVLEKNNAARVILNKNLNGNILGSLIDELLSDEKTLRDMAANSRALGKSDAAEHIADIILSLVK